MKRTTVFLVAAVVTVLLCTQGFSETGGLRRFIPEQMIQDLNRPVPEVPKGETEKGPQKPAGPSVSPESQWGPGAVSPAGPGNAGRTENRFDESAYIFDKPDLGLGGIIEDIGEKAGSSNSAGAGPGGPSGPSSGPSSSKKKKKKKGPAGPGQGYIIPKGLETVSSGADRLHLPEGLPGSVTVTSFEVDDEVIRLTMDQRVPKLRILEVDRDTGKESTIFSRKNTDEGEAHILSKNNPIFRIQMIWKFGEAEYIREYISRSGGISFFRGKISEELDAAAFDPYTAAERTLYFEEDGVFVSEEYQLKNKKESFARVAGYDPKGELVYARQSWYSLEENGYALDVVQDRGGMLTDLLYKGDRSDLYLRSQRGNEGFSSPAGVRASARDREMFDQEIREKYPSLEEALPVNADAGGMATPTDLAGVAGLATQTDLNVPAGMSTPTDMTEMAAQSVPEEQFASTGVATPTDLTALADPAEQEASATGTGTAQGFTLPENARIWALNSNRYPDGFVYVFITEDPVLVRNADRRARLNHDAIDIEGRKLDENTILRNGSPVFDLLIIE